MTPAAVVLTCAQLTPSWDRSILKPVSPVTSDQVRLIWLEETAAAVRAPGANGARVTLAMFDGLENTLPLTAHTW